MDPNRIDIDFEMSDDEEEANVPGNNSETRHENSGNLGNQMEQVQMQFADYNQYWEYDTMLQPLFVVYKRNM